MKRYVLVLVDIQNDYFPGGRMALPAMASAAGRAADLLKLFRDKGWPVIHVRHIQGPKAPFFAVGTPGADIHQSVAPREDETVIDKRFPNSFRGTKLAEVLKKLDLKNLVICGAMSNMCIDATTRAAVDLEYRCTVVHDACAARPVDFAGRYVPEDAVHAAFMANLAAAYARVASSAELLDRISRDRCGL